MVETEVDDFEFLVGLMRESLDAGDLIGGEVEDLEVFRKLRDLCDFVFFYIKVNSTCSKYLKCMNVCDKVNVL